MPVQRLNSYELYLPPYAWKRQRDGLIVATKMPSLEGQRNGLIVTTARKRSATENCQRDGLIVMTRDSLLCPECEYTRDNSRVKQERQRDGLIAATLPTQGRYRVVLARKSGHV